MPMLSELRKRSRSFIIYIFFGIIIAVFVINFGPQSAGCTTTVVSAGRISGRSISPTVFNFVLSASESLRDFQNSPEPVVAALRGQVMDQLIIRELLADDALKMGLRIPDKEMNDLVVKGHIMVLGQRAPFPMGEDGKFDYDRFSRYVRFRWGLTVKKFKEEQRRELLAHKTRQILRSSVRVSEEEVKAAYIHKNTKVQLQYVRLSPVSYRKSVNLDPARIRTYLAAQKKKVEEYYSSNRTAYEKLPRQVRLAIIRVRAASPEQKGAARKRAEALLARLSAGESFHKVAAEGSDDEETKPQGGRLTWRNEDSPGISKEADKAVSKLKEGTTSGIVEEEDGFVILRLLGRREGSLRLAQVQEEIAEELLREEETVRLARQEAKELIRRARAGEKLEDMFTPEGEQEKDKEGGTADAPASKEQPPGKPVRSPLELRSTTSFGRSGRHQIPGIGISKELTETAFSLKEGEVAPGPFVVGQMVYLVACKDREEADMAKWTKQKNELIEDQQMMKVIELLRDHVGRRCRMAIESNSISINPHILVTPGYRPTKKSEPLPTYRPCQSLAQES